MGNLNHNLMIRPTEKVSVGGTAPTFSARLMSFLSMYGGSRSVNLFLVFSYSLFFSLVFSDKQPILCVGPSFCKFLSVPLVAVWTVVVGPV